jgi:hypothetical protein
MRRYLSLALIALALSACVPSNGAPLAARATWTPAPATQTRQPITPVAAPTDYPAYPAPAKERHSSATPTPKRGLNCAHC